jgi:hypothetical protein
MKTNFKKLALAAGTTAALVGSLSAHAVITGVPGEANLVPLFFWSNTEDAFGGDKNTVVKFTIPRSVGGDTVIDLLTPHVVTAEYEGDSNPALNTVVDPASGLSKSTSRLHWHFLDQQSNHRVNRSFDVSADDVVVINARETLGEPYNGFAGYLVVTTETAATGTRAADFAFAADAWLTVEQKGYQRKNVPSAISIPVLPMTDGVDTTSYPTFSNNVVEKVLGSSKYPVASPLLSGIRTGVVGGQPIRTVDIPLAARDSYRNVVVFWSDRNGLATQADEIDSNENDCSTSFSLPQQLNIWTVGTTGYNASKLAPIALSDSYAKSNATSVIKDAGGKTGLCQTAKDDTSEGGILKLWIQAPSAPAGAVGPYASGLAFTIPVANNVLEPDLDEVMDGHYDDDHGHRGHTQPSQNALDVGTFAGE